MADQAQLIEPVAVESDLLEIPGGPVFVPAIFTNPTSPLQPRYLSDGFRTFLRTARVEKYDHAFLKANEVERLMARTDAVNRYEPLRLGQVYGMMTALRTRKKPFLRMDGGSNYCILRSRTNEPWLIRIYYSDGWGYGAEPASEPHDLPAGSVVVSTT